MATLKSPMKLDKRRANGRTTFMLASVLLKTQRLLDSQSQYTLGAQEPLQALQCLICLI